MAVSNIGSIKPIVWIPPSSTTIYKIEHITASGVATEITDSTIRLTIDDGVTDVVGKFEAEILDPLEEYRNSIALMDQLAFYSSYDASLVPIRFLGYIEKLEYVDNMLRISGRSGAMFYQEITVTKSYTNTESYVIIDDLIVTYRPYRSWRSNIAYEGTPLTISWSQKPFWDAIKEVCTATGYNFFVSATNVAYYYQPGSRINDGEAIVHGYNHLETKEFSRDISLVRNRIIVYGATIDGIQAIATAEDSASQAAYGIREEVISDSSISTETQAQEQAEYILAQKKDPPEIGEVKGLLLGTIQPGQKIYLSDPFNGIPPALYEIISYRHEINLTSGYLTTLVRVNKEPRRIPHILANMATTSSQQQNTSSNPYEMRYSYGFSFDSDSGTHSNTQITEGVLVATSTPGIWVSPAKVLTANVSECYLVMNGETLTGASVQVSGNDGKDWEYITNMSRITLSSSLGSNLKVRVTISSANTQITSLSILYKVQT